MKGWRVDQILTSDLFGLETSRPRAIEKLLERQRELVLLDDPTEAEQEELRSLDEKLSELAPGEFAEDRKAWAVMHELTDRLSRSGSE